MNKRNLYKTFLVLLLSVLFLNSAVSQWTQSNGPYGGIVTSIALNASNDMFIATNGGMFYLANTTSVWAPVNNGLTSLNFYAVAAQGNYVFAGAYEVAGAPGGVFRSTDKGTTWTAVNSGLTNRTILSLGAFGPYIYAGTNGYGLFRSSNNGDSWVPVNSGLSGQNLYINCFNVKGSLLLAGTDNGLIISSDNGSSWTVSTNGLPIPASRIINSITVKDTNKIFIATNSGIYLSTNDGANWTNATSNLSSTSVAAITNRAGNLYAGTYGGGVFRSTNDGTVWTSFNGGLNNPYVTSFAVTGNYIYTGTQGNGVFYSLNDNNWVNSVNGLYNTTPEVLINKGNLLIAGTFLSGVAISSNSGTSWTYSNTGLTTSVINWACNDNDNIYLATNLGVFKSNNNGSSWFVIGNTFTPINYCITVEKVNNRILAGTFGGGVFTTTNEGANWDSFNNGINPSDYIIWAFSSDSGYIYTATGTGGIYRSEINGSSWEQKNSGFAPSSDIRTVVSGGNYLFAGFSSIYRSSDNGNNWVSIANDSLSGKTIRSIYAFDNGNKLFAGTVNKGIYYSGNAGDNWYNVSAGLPSINEANSILIYDNYIFAALLGAGVWRRPLTEVSVKKVSTILPDEHKLEQNFPNPFNPVTNIRFSVPKPEFVSISVYDITGREIASLVNEYLHPGNYQTVWDATEYPSGIYIYKLQSGNYSSSRKMILVK